MHAQIIQAIENFELNQGITGPEWLNTPGNVAIAFEGGDVALFDHEEPGVYQGHLLFKSRGRAAIEHARQAFDKMFDEHGADLLLGLVPDNRRAAKLVVRWAGGRSCGIRDTSNGPCELFVLPKALRKRIDR